MRAGGSKQKGSAFERRIAKSLSFWITGGESQDGLWRTALSGGRASMGKSQTGYGDLGINKDHPEIRQFVSSFCVECKDYKEVSLTQAFFNDKSDMNQWWAQVSKEAVRADLIPMMVVKGDRKPELIVLPYTLSGLIPSFVDQIVINRAGLNVIVCKYAEFIAYFTWKTFYASLRESHIGNRRLQSHGVKRTE